MIPLEKVELPNAEMESSCFGNTHMTCYDTCYPFRLFPPKELTELSFEPITILCGGNGSGKSTLLNVIAKLMGLDHISSFNQSFLFNEYVEICNINYSPREESLHEYLRNSRIITSDDVFNSIIETRRRNEDIEFKQNRLFEAREEYKYNPPRNIDFDDSHSVAQYKEYASLQKETVSKYIRKNIGIYERTFSNGENGLRYFTTAIQPNGIYLLDEPENSLSAEFQMQLVNFIEGMARFYDCQFIIATHSPFLLAIKHAKIYDMDAIPVSVKKWTEISNVKLYRQFFVDHENEF